MRIFFRVDLGENIGRNWPIADFGADQDGQIYILTTNNVHASEAGAIIGGAKADCELVAKLLNMYHSGQIEVKNGE